MGDYAVDDQALEIQQAVQHLYRNRMFADIQVIPGPGSEIFYAHKLILSLFSPVLCDRFYGKNTDNSDNLYVQDADISAVSNMISYFYGETLVLENTFQIKETKKIADRYKIYELSNKCKSKIYELDVDVSNVFAILEVAVEYENKNKERECLEIIGRNQEAVFASEAFIKMKFENVCGIFDDLRKMDYLTEVQYLRSVLRWMGCEIDAHKNKLIEKIQISKLSLDEFSDIVIDFPSFLTNIEISHAMKEIKSAQKTEQASRGRLEESENAAEAGCSSAVDISEGVSVGIPSNYQENGISEKKTKLVIDITNGEEGIKQAVIVVEDEFGKRGLQFIITGDMKQGLLDSLSVGKHTFDNVDISYEGLYFMLACLKDIGTVMSSVNSVEAFKAAVYFQLQKLQDFLLRKISNIVEYDPVFLDSLRCLTFFEDKLLRLICTKLRHIIRHPNFIHCSVQLMEIILEQDVLTSTNGDVSSEIRLLFVTIYWLEARNRLRWDSRSSLLNKIAFENISCSDLLHVTNRYPYFFTVNEVSSILLYKDGTNNTRSRVSLPEWYTFKSRKFVPEECW